MKRQRISGEKREKNSVINAAPYKNSANQQQRDVSISAA